ncbi:AIPR family protein [Fructobacillus ficulneus]|uniref:Abortive phage infection protein C-terminal domain-containing protein n=1 Tax=Fructobacillus ficulneus TaxID=157463 RepID=A0A0K8MHC8_9LACO|nr:AIPR family protein [Fructobacillus ficulneus]GAO99299.1 hypothetical protein FFIC_091260 [Fructobacillus ficulneus]
MITKFDNYYDQICIDLKKIVSDREYTGDGSSSKAFAYWYLKNTSVLNENDIEEILIDGNNDNGIDAYYLDEREHILNLYQFKFPAKKNNNKEIDLSAITKIYGTLNSILKGDIENLISRATNIGFENLLGLLKDQPVYEINVVFVSYNKGVISEGNINYIDEQENILGNDIALHHSCITRENIVNIFEKVHRRNTLDLSFKYKNLQLANNVNESDNDDTYIESWVGVINGKALIQAVHNDLTRIFDENIRLYEKGSSINEGIKNTAENNETAKMFYFYNNGITLICDSAKTSPGNNSVLLKGVSIVNGAQTVNSLASLFQDNKLNDQVSVLIRIIQIQDYKQRAKITEYLNSQTPIKESYFIANNVIIRNLQEDLFNFNYYLERQINEYTYRSKYDDMSKYQDFTILPVEDAVHHYIGGYLNDKANIAKSNKSVLFEPNQIEENIKDITAEKVIKVDVIYRRISEIITTYRKNRRNDQNSEFSKFLGIKQPEYDSNLFSFVNTGDILILNCVINIQNRTNDSSIDMAIKDSILLIKDVIQSQSDFIDSAPATLTKSSRLFTKVQSQVEHKYSGESSM